MSKRNIKKLVNSGDEYLLLTVHICQLRNLERRVATVAIRLDHEVWLDRLRAHENPAEHAPDE